MISSEITKKFHLKQKENHFRISVRISARTKTSFISFNGSNSIASLVILLLYGCMFFPSKIYHSVNLVNVVFDRKVPYPFSYTTWYSQEKRNFGKGYSLLILLYVESTVSITPLTYDIWFWNYVFIPVTSCHSCVVNCTQILWIDSRSKSVLLLYKHFSKMVVLLWTFFVHFVKTLV